MNSHIFQMSIVSEHCSISNTVQEDLAILIVEEELPCSSLNHLQKVPRNSSTFPTSVHSTAFPSHLGNTPVTSHHTLEMPHMEHLEKSWHYMNMMQAFSHFLKRNANEYFAELVSSSNGATWAKRKPLL